MGIGFKTGKCSGCVKEGDTSDNIIVNRRHMLCQRHNRIRLDLQDTRDRTDKKPTVKYKRFSQTFEYCTDWGFNKEMDMFLYIWNYRPHVSWFTGQPIDFHPAHFLHILAKGLGKYPHYRFNPDNIVLGTKHEHHIIDNGNSRDVREYQKKFPNFSVKEFNNKRDKLKSEYLDRWG